MLRRRSHGVDRTLRICVATHLALCLPCERHNRHMLNNCRRQILAKLGCEHLARLRCRGAARGRGRGRGVGGVVGKFRGGILTGRGSGRQFIDKALTSTWPEATGADLMNKLALLQYSRLVGRVHHACSPSLETFFEYAARSDETDQSNNANT